ncbi:MAG: hypothetical protein HUU37_05735 [Bdellovibrionales bacterium]|nr:hypothetical protein [Bdellovibrionales bacterium]
MTENAKFVLGAESTSGASADGRRAEIFRGMSPARKWEEWNRLRDAAWRLKAAGIRACHADWSDQEVENAVRRIFLHAVT